MKIIRKTKSLETIVNIFNNSNKAISVVDLVQLLKNEMNKTTVYRILDKLEEEGFVHSFLALDGLKRYAKCQGCSSELHIDTHPHFQCQKCGKLDCLSEEISIPPISSRQVDFAQILLVGLCDTCISKP